MSDPWAEQGYSAIGLNGTGISMYPVPAERMMNDIAKLLTDARNGWTAAKGRISSLEGKIGEGPMGKPVKEQYEKNVPQIRENIDKLVANLGDISAAGTKAVPMYVQADLDAGQHFEF